MAPRQGTTIIIGAAGAVGKRLCAALTARGTRVIASDRMNIAGSLARIMEKNTGMCVGGIDVCDKVAVRQLFQDHGDENTTVWNLAAPLSVETAMDPAVAEAVTVGGMENVLSAMVEVGTRRICFTDSIGSFGSTAPRTGAKASWLHANPTQDPGSDYGRQKRACRELMAKFTLKHGGDSRFAVLPGVLHSNAVWGNGTTEYALDAMLAAAQGKHFECPVSPDVVLPMVFSDDLMRGLIALQFAPESELAEASRGYCIPGLSFSANELFHEIKQHVPSFTYSVAINENMDKFAKLWPDRLSLEAPMRDLDYEPVVTMPRMVASVMNAHSARSLNGKAAFRSIDTCESGRVNDYMLEKYVRKYLVRGREKKALLIRRQDLVPEIVKQAMDAMDIDKDGKVSMDDFIVWSRNNDVENMVDDYVAQLELAQAA